MKTIETINNYREAKNAMAEIINKHMFEAFGEIEQKFGITPTDVSVNIIEHQEIQEQHPKGVYAGCSVTLGGD